MEKTKLIILTLLTFLLLIPTSYAFASEYDKAVKELYNSKDFLEFTKKRMSGDEATYYYFLLYVYNKKLFKNGKPHCDLSDKDNICFQYLSQAEAITLLLQNKKKGFNVLLREQAEKMDVEKMIKSMYINTELFYIWKTAVLKGLDIGDFLSQVHMLQIDKNIILNRINRGLTP